MYRLQNRLGRSYTRLTLKHPSWIRPLVFKLPNAEEEEWVWHEILFAILTNHDMKLLFLLNFLTKCIMYLFDAVI
jgi:hypothetical protein